MNLIITEMELLKYLTIGSVSNAILNISNKRITHINTTSTNLDELKLLFKIAPNAKSLQVFEVTNELMECVNEELMQLREIKFHFIRPECFSNDMKFTKVSSLDPFMRIPEELHDLIFQHLDESFIHQLTRTWTKFNFD